MIIMYSMVHNKCEKRIVSAAGDGIMGIVEAYFKERNGDRYGRKDI